MEDGKKEPTPDELKSRIRELEDENAELKKSRAEDPPEEESAKDETDPPKDEQRSATGSGNNDAELRAIALACGRNQNHALQGERKGNGEKERVFDCAGDPLAGGRECGRRL